MPSSDASSTASGSHGASTTRTVRRDIHATATSPTTSRPTTARTPAIQIATSAIVNEKVENETRGVAATSAVGAVDGRACDSACASGACSRRARGGAGRPSARDASDEGGACRAEAVGEGGWSGAGGACVGETELCSFTIGSCQRGSAIERTGSMSALESASVQTRCRTAADERPRTTVAIPAMPSTSVTLMRASTAGSQSRSRPVRNAVISGATFMARLRSGGRH